MEEWLHRVASCQGPWLCVGTSLVDKVQTSWRWTYVLGRLSCITSTPTATHNNFSKVLSYLLWVSNLGSQLVQQTHSSFPAARDQSNEHSMSWMAIVSLTWWETLNPTLAAEDDLSLTRRGLPFSPLVNCSCPGPILSNSESPARIIRRPACSLQSLHEMLQSPPQAYHGQLGVFTKHKFTDSLCLLWLYQSQSRKPLLHLTSLINHCESQMLRLTCLEGIQAEQFTAHLRPLSMALRGRGKS